MFSTTNTASRPHTKTARNDWRTGKQGHVTQSRRISGLIYVCHCDIFSRFWYPRQSICYLTDAIAILCNMRIDIGAIWISHDDAISILMRYEYRTIMRYRYLCDMNIARWCDIDIYAIWISYDYAISILCDIDILMRYIDIDIATWIPLGHFSA